MIKNPREVTDVFPGADVVGAFVGDVVPEIRLATLRRLTLAGAMFLAGCRATPPSSVSDAPFTTSTTTMIVHGMGCPLCANNIDKQLLAIAGVRTVSVNLGNGQVRVGLSSDAPPSRRSLVEAVRRSGYTFVRFDDAEQSSASRS